ncbi:MAG TPA: thioesterase family protein [Ilumatobacteraceae bacterium]
MEHPEDTFEFDRATALTRVADERFSGDIHPGWDINGNANGGYLLAMAGSAMRTASGRPDPISVTAHYLAPGAAGPVEITTGAVKAGRQLSTMTGSMRQGERELLRVLGTFGDVTAGRGGFEHIVGRPPDLPPIDECVMRQPNLAAVTINIAKRLKIWLRPGDAMFQLGHKSGTALIEGWLGFVDDRPIDTLALLLAVDAFPPPVFNIDMPPGWVPTVELTAHVRGVPAPGPVRCRFRTDFVQNGFLQEDGEVWDSAGLLVAQSRQLGMVPRVSA